ncbi:MAG: bifunctional [glutamate--ammonia ligase]-adenylyl-L-tyrosine phosphorylase/[glutamate--ammonia-ligase] adenylyltransferase, partial [Zetaproteobacteria bacterium CG02_land_8_20_14_3_00_50_9]
VKGLAPFIYRRYLDYTTVAALAEMKRRIDRQSGAQAFVAGFDVKRGQGGIREIEFIIQSMQLLHGGVHPDLRVTPSMLALKRLTDFGVLDGQESERLRDAYRFWRSVEHAVQARVGEQTQKLPEGFENYLTLALGDEDPKASMRQHADYVQRAFARHVLPLHAESTESWLLGGYGHMFNEFCQDDQQRIRNAMARIDTQLMRGILPERSRKSIETILSYAMPKWLDDANALVAIDSFADLIYAIAGRATWIDLLATHQGAREWLIGVLSASRYLADYLVKTPSLLEWPLSEERGDAEIQRIKEDILQLSIEDEEVFLSSLGRLVDFARMQCALQIDAHQADPLEIGSWMSDIADAAVQMCLRSSLHQLKLPDNFPLVALAMGKHGSREMGLVSDLDMVLVLADDGLQQMQGRSVGEWAQRVGRRVIRQLSGQNPFGAGYEFDARLRPSGNSGILVIAMNGFRQYQLHEAQTWEHQALCRARAVAGPESACREVMMVVREVLSLPRNAALLATEVVAMREKMFEHLGSHSDETINLKLDHGGLVDVEFIAQTARLLFDVEATGTVAILRSLPISASQQWHDTGRQLADTYVKYRQMENILRVELWLSIKALPANDLASEWETFRRHAAIVSVEQLRKTMGDVHRCYQYLMEMLVSSN